MAVSSYIPNTKSKKINKITNVFLLNFCGHLGDKDKFSSFNKQKYKVNKL